MKEIFEPESKTIFELFSGSLYQIPDYQRPYSWVDDQVDQLWDDLHGAFENNYKNSESDPNYFLGSIIAVSADKGYQDIIDGQQRITTLMILFCVIRDLCPAINSDVDPDANPYVVKISKIRKCIFDDNELKRLKFKTAPSHQNDFQETIINAKTDLIKKPTPKSLKTSPKSRFENAAYIFSEKIKNLKKNGDGNVGDFVNYLFNSVKVIKITCNNRSFAIKLFQSLNATGLDLTSTDLLKSYLLSRLPDDQTRQFVDDWNRVEVISSETDFKDLNEMFVSYEYYLLGSNPKRSLNDELEDLFKDKDPNKVINDIKSYIKIYRDDVCLSNSKIIYSLRYLRWAVYSRTIITAAYKENYPSQELLFNEINRFYYLYWIAGKTLTQIKQSSFNILKWIKENKDFEFIKSELRTKLLADKVEEQAINNLKGFVYNEPWFKPLLLQIEYAQTDDSKDSFIELNTDLHAEHIIPIEYKKFKEWNHITAEDFEKFGNSIGNLTLLSGSKNIEASNNPFHEKIDIYKGNGKNKSKKDGVTAFQITQKIVNEKNAAELVPNWTLVDTKKRWNWFCDEVQSLLDIDLKSIKLN